MDLRMTALLVLLLELLLGGPINVPSHVEMGGMTVAAPDDGTPPPPRP